MFLFFFQAEDGIRDIGVTGVQTCALPIFADDVLKLLVLRVEVGRDADARAGAVVDDRLAADEFLRDGGRVFDGRSEERRVGEKGRSRWSAYHLKKKQ